MLSIKPKWCEKIANGEKTIEVRKTKPNIKVPFKCYIYCTQPQKPLTHLYRISEEMQKKCNIDYEFTTVDHNKDSLFWGGELNEKIIGEFICDKIDTRYIDSLIGSPVEFEQVLNNACLRQEEFLDYYKDNDYYFGYHISNLKIYDKPKELSEFRKKMKCYQPGNEESIGCWEKCCIWQAEGLCTGKYTKLTRPPQSWCYCEDLGE